MKIKDGFEVVTLGKDHVVVATGMQNINFSDVIYLNESAHVMWHAAEGREFSVEDMAKALTEEYDVDSATALSDAASTAAEWKKMGMID